MIGPSIQDHESPVDLFEDQDPCHQVGKGQVRQFPPQIRPFFQGGSGAEGTGDDKDQISALLPCQLLPVLQSAGKSLAVPHASVQIQQDDQIGIPEPAKGPLCLGIPNFVGNSLRIRAMTLVSIIWLSTIRSKSVMMKKKTIG